MTAPGEQLQGYINQAQELMNGDRKSPRVSIWKTQVKALLAEAYGGEYVDIFDRIFWVGVTTPRTDFDALFRNNMTQAVDLLEGLQDVPHREASGAAKSKTQSATSGGAYQITATNVIIGDNGAINNHVTVGDFINALTTQIEGGVEDGPKKTSMLQALKELTTNESFASVVGAGLTTVLSTLIKGQ